MTFVNRIARSLTLTVLACFAMLIVTFGGIFLWFTLLGLHVWTQAVAGMTAVMGMKVIGWMINRYSRVQQAMRA